MSSPSLIWSNFDVVIKIEIKDFFFITVFLCSSGNEISKKIFYVLNIIKFYLSVLFKSITVLNKTFMLLNAFYNDNDVLKFFENVIFLTKHTFIIIGKNLDFLG